MQLRTSGIHHVTAIAGDPQRNVDFYAGLLGLRFVKKTVNFDDPGTYHLYFGDETGNPGTILTFFPWGHAPAGVPGAGQMSETTFSAPASAVDAWQERLEKAGAKFDRATTPFGEPTLRLRDPDGLPVAIVGAERDDRTSWADGPVPEDQALRGFHHAELTVADPAPTAAVLKTLGFREVAREETATRYVAAADGPGAYVDLVATPQPTHGRVARGSVHHIAWRATDRDEQARWQEHVAAAGLRVTPILDRNYFTSIYFREPGGVLFEIATDPPGFTADEPAESLGTRLMLPKWLEPHRNSIEAALPPIQLPEEAPRRTA